MTTTSRARARARFAPLVAACAASVAGGAAAANTRLGCNAEGMALGRNFFFADLVKQSTFGWPAPPFTVQNVTTDAAGWPTQDFALLAYNEPGGFTYPAAALGGVYTVTAGDGCATSVTAATPGTSVLNSSCSGPGGSLIAYVQVSADGALVGGRIALIFSGTTRTLGGGGGGGGLARLSFLQPGYAIGTDPETLTPAAIAQFRRCSLIRFLGWTLVGHTQWDDHTPPSNANWSQRAIVGQPSYVLGGWGIAGNGAPWETAALLCNAVGADMWVNLPSSADESLRDDYATKAITLLDGMLGPGQRLFVEYGNECFFGNNQCYADDVAVANATVLSGGDPHRLNFGLATPPNATANLLTWGSRMYTWTCLRLAELAGQVVGASRVGRADTPGVRVVPVLGALGNYAPDLEAKASWLFAAWGPPAAQGLATVNIGAYVGSGVNKSDASVTAALVVDDLLGIIANMTPSAPTAYGNNPLAEFAAVTAHWGLALHAYEGGPDTSGGTAATLMALANASLDARMADVVTGIVANWQRWGNGMFNFFIIGAQPLEQPWGSYSDLWDMTVTATPKSKGLDTVASTPPAAVTAGWPLPVLYHPASFSVGYYAKDGLPPTDPDVTWLPPKTVLPYLVRLDSPCVLGLNVTVYMSNSLKSGGDPLGVSVGVFLPEVNVTAPQTGGNRSLFLPAAPALFPPLPAAALPNGLVAVRLHVVTAVAPHFALRALDVTCRTA
jgi:hypothetical protein